MVESPPVTAKQSCFNVVSSVLLFEIWPFVTVTSVISGKSYDLTNISIHKTDGVDPLLVLELCWTIATFNFGCKIASWSRQTSSWKFPGSLTGHHLVLWSSPRSSQVLSSSHLRRHTRFATSSVWGVSRPCRHIVVLFVTTCSQSWTTMITMSVCNTNILLWMTPKITFYVSKTHVLKNNKNFNI